MTMITPSYLGETIEYSSLHACRSTLEDPTLTEDFYKKEIQPQLNIATLSQIAAAINVSIPYASDIRRGRRRPHPRNWKALGLLVGIEGVDETTGH